MAEPDYIQALTHFQMLCPSLNKLRMIIHQHDNTLLLQVSGREVFEFNPALIMEDDEDTEGEVFVHHHEKVIGWGYMVGGAILLAQHVHYYYYYYFVTVLFTWLL